MTTKITNTAKSHASDQLEYNLTKKEISFGQSKTLMNIVTNFNLKCVMLESVAFNVFNGCFYH